MDTTEIMMLGLGLQAPWKLESQHLETSTNPYELHLHIGVDKGNKFPCPDCGTMCSVHDYVEKRWRHLNFFQHHCYLTAKVPRIKCSEHNVRLAAAPWARPSSGFTLLFEQVILSLAREMPVKAIARFTSVTDQRLWRIIQHYVDQGLAQLDLSEVQGVALDETASKRGHNYVTTFLDMEKPTAPVIFATKGRSGDTLNAFKNFLCDHGGEADKIKEVVSDMSPAFLSGVRSEFPNASITVDWFHVVQTFTKALDSVRKLEAKSYKFPKSSRFAVLKKKKKLTVTQALALGAILEEKRDTARAWAIKEGLGWIRQAKSTQEARERVEEFVEQAKEAIKNRSFTESVVKAVETLEKHSEQIIRRWTSTYTNARMEAYNSLFQAAKARARGYRNTDTFIAMIYLIGSPIRNVLKPT